MCWRTWRSAGCGPRGSWPTCRWRWPAGSPGTTRCCAACTWTGSPSSTTRWTAWMGGSPARPRAGSGRRACSPPCRASATWWRRPGWARSAPPRTCIATHEKLASGSALCPGNNVSARKRKHGRPGNAGHLRQADAGPGRLGRDPGPRPAPAPGTTGWSAGSAGPEPGGEEEGDHRDRAHPAQDRLPGAQERGAVPGASADFYARRGSTTAEAGLAGAPAAKAPPRLHRHHHRHPAAGAPPYYPALNQQP